MKQKYYSSKTIESMECQYNIIIGERSNGKSYAMKTKLIQEAFCDENKKFILLRRWDVEVKPSMVESYFSDIDIKLLTNGEYDGIIVYRGIIYLAIYDEKEEKLVKGISIGYTRALSLEHHYRSGAYKDVKNILFEEFVTASYYIPSEPQKLMHFISTVARRQEIKVWLVGNTVSRLNPYFNDWGLIGVVKQKAGTIEEYRFTTNQYNEDGTPVVIRIALEFCETSGKNSKMFFGTGTKMITSGVWETTEHLHLDKPKEYYHVLYKMYMSVRNLRFCLELLADRENGNNTWFCYPYTKKIPDGARVISDSPAVDPLTTIGFSPLSEGEKDAFRLIPSGKICFSDNLAGTDFDVALNYLKGR